MANCIMGATAMACAIAGLFFFRFWRETGDRLFAIFAVAFWLFGMTRIVLALLPDSSEHEIYVYLVRLAVFALILLAVLDKNRPRTKAQLIVPE
jgi:hypothetical protein